MPTFWNGISHSSPNPFLSDITSYFQAWFHLTITCLGNTQVQVPRKFPQLWSEGLWMAAGSLSPFPVQKINHWFSIAGSETRYPIKTTLLSRKETNEHPQSRLLSFFTGHETGGKKKQRLQSKVCERPTVREKKNYFCLHWLPQEYQKTSSYHISTRNGNKSMSSRKTLSL